MKWMQSNTSQPPYLVYPWFLLGAHLSDTARLLYCLLLNRAKLSQSNSWIDDDGNVFVVYPISELANTLHRCETVVRTGLHQLEEQGLIKRCHVAKGKASHILIGIPPSENRRGPKRNPEPNPGGKPLTSKQGSYPKKKESFGTPLAGRNYDCKEGESL